MKPKKPCNNPLCGKLTYTAYCNEHRPMLQPREQDKYEKFYKSWKWQKARNAFIRSHPLCKQCDEEDKVVIADVVDHIIPIRVNYSLRLYSINFQSLCHQCHSDKTKGSDKDLYGNK